MAFTPQEINIIKQVKEQGGTMQQAEAVIAKVRAGGSNTVVTKPAEKEKFSLYNSLFTSQNPTVAALKPLFSTENPAITPVVGIASGARKFGADVHKIQTGYFDEMAQGKAPSTGTNLGFVGKNIAGAIKQEADFSKRKAEQGDIGQTGVEKGIDIFSQGIKMPFVNVPGQIASSALSIPVTEQQKTDARMVGQKIAASDVGQAVGRTIGDLALGAREFEKQNPRTASQLRNVGIFAETAGNLVGAGIAKKGVAGATEQATKTVEVPDFTGKTQAFKDFVSGKVTDVKNIGKVEGVENIPVFKPTQTEKIGGSFTDRIKSGLSKEQIAGYQSNPMQKDEVNKLYKRIESPEGISDIKDYKVERIGAVTKELTDKIDEIRATKGETGKVYEGVRNLDIKVDVGDTIRKIDETLSKKGIIKDERGFYIPDNSIESAIYSDTDLSNINKFVSALKYDARDGSLSPAKVLKLRDLSKKYANYDASKTSDGMKIFQQFRRDINETTREKIPGLKELDEKFQDKIEDFEDAVKDLVYKGGDVKGEWRSNIVNIIGTLDKSNRAKLLGRLEEIMPGIGERIKAIDNIPGILKAIQDKGKLDKFTGIGGALSGATIGATMGPAGAIVGFLLGYGGGKLLDAGITGIRKKAILKILSKMSPEGIKKLAVIRNKIKKKLLLTKSEKQELDNLKETFKKEVKDVKPRLLLPAGKKPPIVTPQTAEKAVIAESKKDLEKTKFGERLATTNNVENYNLAKQLITDTNSVKNLEELKNSIIEEGLAKGKELIDEIEEKIAGIRGMEVLDDVGDIAKKEYGEDLFSSFKKLFSSENRTIKTKSGDKYTDIENQRTPQAKEFSEKAKEYLAQNPWIDKSVQEVYEDMKDLVKKQVSKQPLKLNSTEIKTTLSNLNKSNIDEIASKITTDPTKLAKVKEVIQKYLREYGENIKNYLGLLADDIADIVGGRAKLLGGENARLFDKSRWEQAKEMTKAGKNADEVWQKTGWEKGTDGKWKFEIDDSDASLNMDIKGDSFKLGDFLNHNELFNQYPRVKNLQIKLKELPDNVFAEIDNDIIYFPRDIKDNIYGPINNIKERYLKSSLIHEIQHYIQKQEGFARGGDGTIKLSQYKRLAGETEARNIQTRLLKSSKENKLLRPAKTEDVARSKQIVKMNGGKAMLTNSKQVSKVSDDLISEVRKFKSAEEFEIPYKKEIKPGEDIIVVTGSKINPELKSYGKGGGQLGDGIYFTTDIDKAKGYGDLYITKLKIENPLYADKDYSLTDMEKIFGKGQLDDVFFGSKEKSGREIAENISNSKNREGLFKKLTNEFDAVMYKDGFEVNYFKPFKTTQLKQIYEQANKPKLLKPSSVSKVSDDLIKEARKYDYANGFISDYYKKPNILKWGGPEVLEGGIPKIKHRGAVFLAENTDEGKNYAEGYSKLSGLIGKSKVHNIELDKNAKIFDIRNKQDKINLKNALGDEYDILLEGTKRGKAIEWTEIEPIIKYIKSLGYDGAIVLERPKGHILQGVNGKYKSLSDINSYAIFNTDKIKIAKTEAQLKQIYEQSKKTK